MAVANPHKAANASLPDSSPDIVDQDTSIQKPPCPKDLKVVARKLYDNPLATVAVVHPKLCAREPVHMKLRENLLAYMRDEFEVANESGDKVWLRADGTAAENSRTFLDEDNKPIARISDIATRRGSAVQVEGPGYEFTVRAGVCP